MKPFETTNLDLRTFKSHRVPRAGRAFRQFLLAARAAGHMHVPGVPSELCSHCRRQGVDCDSALIAIQDRHSWVQA